MDNIFLFVYGTLKKGQGNHYLLGDSPYIGEGFVRGRLMARKGGGFPYMVEDPLSVTHGEIYLVGNLHVLKGLDNLEGHPTFYKRMQVPGFTINLTDEDEPPVSLPLQMQAYFYQGSTNEPNIPWVRVPGGMWKGPVE